MTAREWTLWVEVTRPDGTSERHAVGSIQRDTASPGLDGLGLQAVAEAQALLRQVQRRLVQDHAAWQSGRRDASPVEQARGGGSEACPAAPDGEGSGERRGGRQRGGKRHALSSTGRDGSGEAATGPSRGGPRQRGKA